MTTKSLLLAFAVLILFFQIYSLRPQLIPKSSSIGDFVSISQKDAVLLSQELLKATFSINSKDSLIFTGDILLARNVEFLMKQNGNDYPFKLLSLQSLSQNSAIIGNFESAMPKEHITTRSFGMTFSVDPVFLGGLRAAGFTHLSLANNHSFDFGNAGYENAITQLQNNDLTTFGNGKDVGLDSLSYIDTKQGRIALVAINASDLLPNKKNISMVLDTASSKSDTQVIYIHWGNEYETKHSPAQEELAKWLVDSGADLIVGHHPHVVQDIGMIDGVLVFYSLGNYIFDQYFSEEVQNGLILSLDTGVEELRIRLLPVTSLSHHSQPSLMTSEAQTAFLKALAASSDPKLASEIEEGVITLPHMVATSQKMAIMVR